jgi:DoxX-like family
MSPKAKKILGWVLASLLALLAIGSGFGKLTATPASEMGVMFTAMGFYDLRMLIGGIEILCAVLLLIPRTSTIGVWMSGGYWGGAIATDLTHGHSPVAPIIILAILGLVALVRNPEMFTRLLGKEPVA